MGRPNALNRTQARSLAPSWRKVSILNKSQRGKLLHLSPTLTIKYPHQWIKQAIKGCFNWNCLGEIKSSTRVILEYRYKNKVSDEVKYKNLGMTNLKGDQYECSTKG